MLAPLIAAGVLFIALVPGLPYGYFQILRWVVCGVTCYGALMAIEKDRRGWIWAMAGMAILFNPILPIRFSRQTWQLIDLAAGTLLLFSIPIFKNDKRKLDKSESATASRADAVHVAPGNLLKSEANTVWKIADLELILTQIAPGAFTMGSDSGDRRETPPTRVRITQSFWLGRTAVTQREWRAVMGGNPSEFKGNDRPVENVSWDDATEFCSKLTQRERAANRLPAGYAYLLPTEAQWEFACRAGSTGDFAGNLDDMGWLV